MSILRTAAFTRTFKKGVRWKGNTNCEPTDTYPAHVRHHFSTTRSQHKARHYRDHGHTRVDIRINLEMQSPPTQASTESVKEKPQNGSSFFRFDSKNPTRAASGTFTDWPAKGVHPHALAFLSILWSFLPGLALIPFLAFVVTSPSSSTIAFTTYSSVARAFTTQHQHFPIRVHNALQVMSSNVSPAPLFHFHIEVFPHPVAGFFSHAHCVFHIACICSFSLNHCTALICAIYLLFSSGQTAMSPPLSVLFYLAFHFFNLDMKMRFMLDRGVNVLA